MYPPFNRWTSQFQHYNFPLPPHLKNTQPFSNEILQHYIISDHISAPKKKKKERKNRSSWEVDTYMANGLIWKKKYCIVPP
jgi:hypothetical protein